MVNSSRYQKGFYTCRVPHRTFKSFPAGQIYNFFMVLHETFFNRNPFVVELYKEPIRVQVLFVVGFYIEFSLIGELLNVLKMV